MQNKITQAVLLSAGLGTRLRPITDTIPKVMVPLAGKPLLEHHIDQLNRCGVNEFFINLFYLPDVITGYFGDGSKLGVKIHYFLEKPEVLGTAGGVKNFEKLLGDRFIVLYGDTFYEIDYERLITFYLSHSDATGMGTARKTDHPWDSDLGVVGEDGKVLKFLIKPHKELPQNYWGMSAPYVFEKKVLEYVPTGAYYEIAHNIVPDLLARGYCYYAYKLREGEFRKDIGTIERYREVEEYLKTRPHSIEHGRS